MAVGSGWQFCVMPLRLLVGALYLDSGIEVTRELCTPHHRPRP